ncbi:Protein SYM1 [Monoraphidium neglectum]|uniref:Protein SYM1 n=1 Tax=Monoraphidium neglectum TaxID=145388 RepID=A0A0D2N202_9CHLO|nr:Protein SYM1 [Monoraphidium neglectum]KIZ00261.1 Protein SYM1 [Monoraphidium neglectum]|eukprot:XP_013899280.1 Protein SYM1 [Monoraphidium neglectum]
MAIYKRMATGDALAQQLEDVPFDARRNLLTCAYGAAFIGPVGHAWYMALDRAARALLTPGSFAFVGGKVIADTALFGPLHVAGYFTHMALCEGGGPEEVMRKLRRDFWPTFSAELTVWPVVQAANFKLVPVQFQLLVVNLFTILDSCFMSFARANDGWFERLFPDLAARLGVEAPPAAAAAAAAAAADVSVAGGGSTKEKKES